MTLRSLAASPCAFCGIRNSTPTGEHVLPGWFLKRYLPISDGHYTTEIGQEAVLNQKGQPRKHPWPEVRVPACEICNQALRDRFEVGASLAAVQKFFDPPPTQLSADEAELAGSWLLKTWVLLAHPDFVHIDGQDRPHWSGTQDRWTWAATGAAPPADLSVWVVRQDINSEAADRVDVSFQGEAKTVGIHEWCVTALSGTLWKPVDQAFAEASRMVWPASSDPFDFGTLPLLPRNQIRWLEYPFPPPPKIVAGDADA